MKLIFSFTIIFLVLFSLHKADDTVINAAANASSSAQAIVDSFLRGGGSASASANSSSSASASVNGNGNGNGNANANSSSSSSASVNGNGGGSASANSSASSSASVNFNNGGGKPPVKGDFDNQPNLPDDDTVTSWPRCRFPFYRYCYWVRICRCKLRKNWWQTASDKSNRMSINSVDPEDDSSEFQSAPADFNDESSISDYGYYFPKCYFPYYRHCKWVRRCYCRHKWLNY
jgi:hypothetical protein